MSARSSSGRRRSSLGWKALSLSRKTSSALSGRLKATDERPEDIRILTATWNVGGKKPPLAKELEHWLPANGTGYDLIVIGTQENPNLGKGSESSTRAGSYRADEEGSGERGSSTKRPPTLAPTISSLYSPDGTIRWEEEEEEEGEEEEDESQVVARKGACGESEADKEVNAAETARLTWTQRLKSRLQMSFHPDHASGQHIWDALCQARLGADWMVLEHVTLRAMRLTVYCTNALHDSGLVTHVSSARVATGIGGVYGNKGGLVVRLCIGPTTLAFCSCHLAAFEGPVNQRARNAMCRKVLLKTMGGKSAAQTSRRAHPPALGSGLHNRSLDRLTIRHRHDWRAPLDIVHAADHVVWLGDLNYRIDLGRLGKAPAEGGHAAHVQAVRDLIDEGAWPTLMAADGLVAARETGDAFVDFTEGRYDFAPTYKARTLQPRATCPPPPQGTCHTA